MPRAKVTLTVDDLLAILADRPPIEKLKEWARAELDRRVKAGSLGGRPKRGRIAADIPRLLKESS